MSNTSKDKNPAANTATEATTTSKQSTRSIALWLCAGVAVYLLLQMWLLPIMGGST